MKPAIRTSDEVLDRLAAADAIAHHRGGDLNWPISRKRTLCEPQDRGAGNAGYHVEDLLAWSVAARRDRQAREPEQLLRFRRRSPACKPCRRRKE